MKLYLATLPPGKDGIRCEILRRMGFPGVPISYYYITSEKDVHYWFDEEENKEGR